MANETAQARYCDWRLVTLSATREGRLWLLWGSLDISLAREKELALRTRGPSFSLTVHHACLFLSLLYRRTW